MLWRLENVSLLLPFLMVSEFGGASQLFTTIKIKVEVKTNHLQLTSLHVTQSISSPYVYTHVINSNGSNVMMMMMMLSHRSNYCFKTWNKMTCWSVISQRNSWRFVLCICLSEESHASNKKRLCRWHWDISFSIILWIWQIVSQSPPFYLGEIYPPAAYPVV